MPALEPRFTRLFVSTMLALAAAGCAKKADPYIKKGDAAFERHDYQAALNEYREAEKIEPENTHVLRQQGLAYSALGDHPSAIHELEQARLAAPRDTVVLLAAGEIYLADGRFDEAEAAAKALLDVSPNNVAGLNLEGSALLGKKDVARALAMYQKIAQLTPTDPRAPYFVGVGLLASGKSEEAAKQFRSALALRPTYLDPLTKLVEIDLSQQRSDSALAEVNRQIAVVGDSAPIHELLAIIRIARGERELAETALRKVMALDPKYLDPYVRLSELYRGWGKNDQAIAVTKKALEIDPNNLSIRLIQGVTYEGLGDRTNAALAYENALKVNPRFVAAANNLATLLADSASQLDRALQLIKSAKDAEPNNPAVLDTYGWVLFKRGDFPGAISVLSAVASQLPNEPTVAFHLGSAEAGAGNVAAARKDLSRAVGSRVAFPERRAAEAALARLK